MEEAIRKNTELLIHQVAELLGVVLVLDGDGVAWLDGYIDRIKSDRSTEEIDRLVNVCGSFFGECLRSQYGGTWQEIQGQWAIAFDDRNAIFPFNKVAKKFREADESLVGLYRSVPVVFRNIPPAEHLDQGQIETLVQMLEVLSAYEYQARKYRAKGDAWYEMGREWRTVEYHNQAAEEERRARELAARIEETYGPDGGMDRVAAGPGQTDPDAAALPSPWSDPMGDFDAACFYARHPRWARHAPRLAAAYAHWKNDPRFIREAPRYRPVNPEWLP